MNNTDNHISTWSMTDVQKYLRGELPPADMHRLEKLALDDPFLADALEGLQTHAPIGRDLTELRARLGARIADRKKLIAMTWFRIAAAVILLLGVGITAWYTIVDKNLPAVAKTPIATGESQTADSTRMTPSALTAQKPAPASAIDTAAQSSIAVARVHPKKAAAAEKAVVVVTSDKTPDTTGQPAPVDKGLADAIIKTDSIHSNSEFKKYSSSITSSSELFPHRNADMMRSARIGANPNPPATANLLVFSGRVLDGNHRPVAGASLFFNTNHNSYKPGTVTDRQGKFNLYLPTEDTTRHLTVAMAGYQNVDYALNTDDRTGNTIYLKEKPSQLQEVVISGYGAKRKEALAASPSDNPEVLDSLWLKAAPAMGRIAYLNYIETAGKSLPVDTTIHGIESISFLVDQKGTLSEFKIERSLSPAHDAGLIHLISDGPPWKMIHGKKARAVVTVSYP